MIRAVLFDMDGLLIDSERVAMESVVAVGKQLGYAIPMALAMQTLGVTREHSIALYTEHVPGYDGAAFYRAFDAEIARRVAHGDVPAKQGAQALLAHLQKAGIPRAVASSSGQERVEMCLRKAGLADFFSVVVTGDQVTHSKPDPEIFLLAAKKLGVAPAECLVLEDSVNGIKAGRAGGMQVCMVPDLLPYRPEYAPFCDHVVQDLSQVIPLLG